MARSLRIGVVLGDQLVEERIFDGSAPITFGQSLRCALSVPVDAAPREHVLFANGVLRLPPGMTGRIGRGDGVTAITTSQVAIERGMRGKLLLGELTLLFQEIAPRPRVPPPQLPASIRGTFADRIDGRLAMIVGGSLVVHLGIAAYAWAGDAPMRDLAQPISEADYEVQTIDLAPDVTPPPAMATPDQPGPTSPTSPAVPHHAPSRPAAPIAPPAPPSVDDATRMATILTGATESPNGITEMRSRRPGADLEKQIEDASHHPVAIGDNAHRSRPGDLPRIGTATNPGGPLDGPHYATLDHGPEATAPGHIHVGSLETGIRTTLTPQAVLDKINSLYMSGLTRCYQTGLAHEGVLGGSVAVEFTVGENGHVTDPSATGVSPTVDACIASEMLHWRFVPPHTKTGEPTDQTMQLVLVLVHS
jgi:hypothetical protein